MRRLPCFGGVKWTLGAHCVEIPCFSPSLSSVTSFFYKPIGGDGASAFGVGLHLSLPYDSLLFGSAYTRRPTTSNAPGVMTTVYVLHDPGGRRSISRHLFTLVTNEIHDSEAPAGVRFCSAGKHRMYRADWNQQTLKCQPNTSKVSIPSPSRLLRPECLSMVSKY